MMLCMQECNTADKPRSGKDMPFEQIFLADCDDMEKSSEAQDEFDTTKDCS